ncbi:MAG TPA: dTDP-4-dehydrorhamnose 3,5-epimerase [Rubricoccaceae bacterium]|jgi:dTDP-4-dehydrorhamnose 3,5-epimerase
MTVTETTIPGVLLVRPVVHGDTRGFFVERYHAGRYAAAGIGPAFVQDNHSRSRRGVLRGLHFQKRHPQGKLVEVLRGRLFDVVVDVRPGSPTFGRAEGFTLDADEHRQLWVPPGLAHGFCVLSDAVDFLYKCTDVYRPDDEGGVVWDDPDLGVAWPIEAPLLSDKDRALPRLRDLTRADLPDAPFEAGAR